MICHKTISLTRKLAGSALIFSLLFSPGFAEKIKKYPATILYVIDGDTIKVIYENKKESVRLIGIDTPESRKNKRAKMQAKQARTTIEEIVKLGKHSKEFTKTMLKKGDIVLIEFDVQERDKYRRLLGYVYLKNGKMVNLEIIREGYASPLTIPPSVRYSELFLKAYREARENKRGLWKQ